ncbi:MAG: ABC transporter permease subunit [Pseudomonadota bacterium]|nr:ABC transporter permease subunit [Pseudomonadota bacterium]
MTEIRRSRQHSRAAWWNDKRARALMWQILVVALLLLGLWAVIHNLLANLDRLGLPLNFDFLTAPAGFAVSFTLIPISLESPIWRLILTGALNTLLASAVSIILATVLGLVVGMGRLSSNILVSCLATAFVETVRNVPVLVQLLFWYVAIIQLLPVVRNSVSFLNVLFLNNRGLNIPKPMPVDHFNIVLGALLIGIFVALGMARWARRRQEATGLQFPRMWAGLGVAIGLPLIVILFLGSPVTWDIPNLQGFNFEGGLAVRPELTSLILGMSVYTAAFVAEIVRGGIHAISHGQTEAAFALGLRPGLTLRLVIIPQTLRIIIPPLTSEYLNNVKNTTLAAAIAYPDLFSIVSTSLNQTGRAVENISIMMGFFLALSLLISLTMNSYNRRISLVGR